MKIKLIYFGQISKIVGHKNESIEVENKTDSAELNDLLHDKYGLQQSEYRLAINHDFINTKVPLKENDEITLLPPFVGG